MTYVRSPLPLAVPSSGDWMHDRLTEARGILADTARHPDTLAIIAARVVVGLTGDSAECSEAIDMLRARDQRHQHAIAAAALAMGRLDVMVPLVGDWPFDVLLSHNRFTLLNRSADKLFDIARARGITVLNAAPYAGGVLAKGTAQIKKITYQDASEAALAPVRQVEGICAEHGVAPGAVALQFSLNDPRVASTIVGVSRTERVTQTLDWMAAAIPAQAWDQLGHLPYETEDPEAHRVYRPG